MDYVKPADVASAMINAGRTKLALSPVDLIIRGGLAGGILAAATSLAITGAVQTDQPLVGALIFPVGLILIVLLGLDLVTGSFGLLPLPWIESDTDAKTMLANWGWVFVGNLIGSVVYGGLLAIALTFLVPPRRPASPQKSLPSPKRRPPGMRRSDMRG
jgi:formate transporter